MRILALLVLALSAAPAAMAQGSRYDLVVFLAVDQLRPDYFPRWDGDLTGGLRRFYDRSAFYARGEQDHALTETAPGHATMLTGRSPAAVGIVSNSLGVPDTASPLLEVPGPGASPARFRGTTLFDWMQTADRDTRVLSVSRKDRGAILPIGQARVPVFWYQGGYFTTSTWYGTALPEWVRAWNARRGAFALGGTIWDLFLPTDRYTEADDQPWELGGRYHTFPYPLPPDTSAGLPGLIANLPWADSLTLDLALEGVHQLGLGARGRPDLLAISLSSTDAVGHNWGPDSREMHDQIVRLDHWMAWFMDSLATLVPRERTLYVLTSDHGVTSFPEFTLASGRMAGRATGTRTVQLLRDSLTARHGQPFGVAFDNGLLYGQVEAMRTAGVNVDSLSKVAASLLAHESGVTRIYTPQSLMAYAADDRDASRWRRSIPADFEWLAAASVAPNYLWSFSTAATTHGTTNNDDVLVPIAFLGQGVPAARLGRARTVDIAPTLAALLGIQPLETVEGMVLPEVVVPPVPR